MKLTTYLLPFFLAVSTSSAKDSTHRNRKLGYLGVGAEGNTKSSKTSADSDGVCIFGLLTRRKIVGGLVNTLYEHGAPDHGAGFSFAQRQLYVQENPEFLKEFEKIGLHIGVAHDEDGHWPHEDLVGYFKLAADTYYKDTDFFIQ